MFPDQNNKVNFSLGIKVDHLTINPFKRLEDLFMQNSSTPEDHCMLRIHHVKHKTWKIRNDINMKRILSTVSKVTIAYICFPLLICYPKDLWKYGQSA